MFLGKPLKAYVRLLAIGCKSAVLAYVLKIMAKR